MSDAPNAARARVAPKLCKDCVFVRPKPWWDVFSSFNRFEFAQCSHPEAKVPVDRENYPVDGKLTQHFCSTARRFWFLCGPEARWFEPRDAEAPL